MLEQENGTLEGFRWVATPFRDHGPSASEKMMRREHGRMVLLHLIYQITEDPVLPWRPQCP